MTNHAAAIDELFELARRKVDELEAELRASRELSDRRGERLVHLKTRLESVHSINRDASKEILRLESQLGKIRRIAGGDWGINANISMQDIYELASGD